MVMNSLSLKMKLGVGFGTLLLTLIAMGVLAYNSFGQLVNISGRVDLIMVKKDMSSRIETSIEKQSTGIRGYLLVGREDLLQQDEEGKQAFAENMENLAKLLITDEGKRLHAEIRRAYDEFRATSDHEIQLRRAGNEKEAAELCFNPQSTATRNQMHEAVADLVVLEDNLKHEAIKEQAAIQARSVLIVLGLTLVGIVFGLLVAIVITRSIIGVISRMVALIQEIANKNLDVADIEVSSEDEIGNACIALNEMKNSLREMIHSIADTAQRVASASEELSVTSQQISANSDETSAQAGTVSQATQHVSQNLLSVSTGASEMTTTIQSIASNAHEAATVASNAVQTAQSANTIVGKLGGPAPKSARSLRSSLPSPSRPTCLPSTPPLRPPAPARLGRASPWLPTKSKNWPSKPPKLPKTSAARSTPSRPTPTTRSKPSPPSAASSARSATSPPPSRPRSRNRAPPPTR